MKTSVAMRSKFIEQNELIGDQIKTSSGYFYSLTVAMVLITTYPLEPNIYQLKRLDQYYCMLKSFTVLTVVLGPFTESVNMLSIYLIIDRLMIN